MYQAHLNPGIACIHGNRITECRHCVAERIEWLAWQRRTDQILEVIEAMSWPIVDEAPTLVDLSLAVGVARV